MGLTFTCSTPRLTPRHSTNPVDLFKSIVEWPLGQCLHWLTVVSILQHLTAPVIQYIYVYIYMVYSSLRTAALDRPRSTVVYIRYTVVSVLKHLTLDSPQSTVRVRTEYFSLRTAALDSPRRMVRVCTAPAQQQHLKTSTKINMVEKHFNTTINHSPTQFTTTHQQ